MLPVLMGAQLAAYPAFAQTASQITPPTFAPATQGRPKAPLALPEDTVATAPAGAEAVFLTPSALDVEGAGLGEGTLAALRERLAGKRVSVADVYAAAGEAEAAEARMGHVLVRVVVPNQRFVDGETLQLRVIAGFVERIDVTRVPPRVRGRMAALLAGLVGKHDITLDVIERRLMLASDVPGITLRSTLAPGQAPGGTVLEIDASWRPVSVFVTADNTLSDALGREAYSIGADLNSVLGAGELIYLRADGLPNTGHGTSVLDPTPRNRALAAGLVLPLGNDGLTFTVEGTDARTAPRHSAELPGFGSKFDRLSFSLRYPVVRTRALTVGLGASFDTQRERVAIISPETLPLSLDRLRIARAAADISAWLPGGGVATARLEASFGIDGLGARSAADASPLLPLSRAGTDADFTKLAISGRIDQPVARFLEVGVSGRAQTAFGKPLANAEQIGVASVDAISPLPAGTLQGDAGYVVRGEARVPVPVAQGGLLARLTPYGFAAQGHVRFEEPSAFERRDTDAFAYGGGIRLTAQGTAGTPGLSAGFEYGRAHVEGLRPDRVTFTILARF